MISTRIIDNDMGKVMKVPLTGRGTIHGLSMSIDVVVAQEKDKTTGKFVDVIKRYTVPEIDVSLLDMLSDDMGVKRFSEHCEEHLGDSSIEEKFILEYNNFVTPINKSGKVRY